MPSDKHNSITAKVMGLVFLLFDVALFMPFGTLQYVQYMDLPGPSFMSHSSSLTTKGVDFVVGT